MAATVIINRLTGAGPTKTDITAGTTRASASDSPTPGSADPILVPAAGTNYSYWVTTRLEVTVTPTGTIDNLRWHPAVTPAWEAQVGCIVADATSYVQATGTQGTTGTQLTTGNHVGLTGSPVAYDTYTEGSPLSYAGSMTNPTTGDLGNYIVWQITVAAGASAGTISAATARFRYDET